MMPDKFKTFIGFDADQSMRDTTDPPPPWVKGDFHIISLRR